MKKSYRNILLITINSFILILLLNLIIGTYYDEYDILLSNFAYLEITSPMSYGNNYTSWFLFAPIFSFLAKYSFNNYNIFNTLILILNLIILTYNSVILLKVNKSATIVLLNLLTLIFFADIFVSVSNRTMASVSVFSILFLTYNYYLKNIRKETAITVITALLLLCNIIRFEIAMIVFGAGIFVSVIYNEKYLRNRFILYLTVSIFFFALFHILQNTVYKEFNFMEKAEHEFHDRGIRYYEQAADHKEALKLQALSYYIIDSDNLNPNYYKELFLNKSIILNKFNKAYVSHYFERLQEYYTELLHTNSFLIILFSVSTLLFFGISKEHKKKIISVFLFILGLPPLFFLYVAFPNNLMLTLLNISLFGVIIFILKQKYLTNKLITFCTISILILFNLSSLYWKKRDYITKEQPKLSYYRNILTSAKENHKAVVYASFVPNFEDLPSRLFSFKRIDVIPHYYMNMFFYAYYNYYTKHNQQFFSDITSFKRRTLDIINKEAVFMSNEEHNTFIEDYAKNVCNLPIKITPVNIVDFNSYNHTDTPYFHTYQIKLLN